MHFFQKLDSPLRAHSELLDCYKSVQRLRGNKLSKENLKGTWENHQVPCEGVRAQALYPMTELAGALSPYVCDQPAPKSSGRGGFLLDILTHSCSQHLVTESMQKWREHSSCRAIALLMRKEGL